MTRTLTLELEDEVAARAEEISKTTGRSVSEVVSDLLQGLPEKPNGNLKRGGMDTPEPLAGPSQGHASDTQSLRLKAALTKNLKPTPIVDSLIGILRGSEVDEEDYKRYLESKYR